ncbi:hypothetical protein E2C01_030145 [Portunus trituberculatus]|uniref:Uncharacterized protein n=1 Tax=Portunus trituberculatus TaxID=210409 RepID=A0A5B7ETY8_PORTR|nr:hypothetical protein [Portunus trituberculatus]
MNVFLHLLLQGGDIGLGVSLAFNLWMCVGALLFSPAPTMLPFSDEGCNSTTSFPSTLPSTFSKPWTTEQAGKIYLHPTFYALQRRQERRGVPQDPPFTSIQTLVPLEKF